MTLDNLYRSCDDVKFASWLKITNLDNPDNFLKIGANGDLCAEVRRVEIPMYYFFRVESKVTRRNHKKRDSSVKREDFTKIVESVTASVKRIAYDLSSEIRVRFPPVKLLESMSIVFPRYWSMNNSNDYRTKLLTLIDHFCKTKEVNGVTLNGILDESHLRDQSGHFSQTMREQYNTMRNPHEDGSATRLWIKLAESEILIDSISEFFKLADLCLTMILGSVEDERVFSALGFLKSKLRNKLDKNLENCLRLYTSRYEVHTFPYDRALKLWMKKCQRRGLGNISNQSGSARDNDVTVIDSCTGTGNASGELQLSGGMQSEENISKNQGSYELDGDESDNDMSWQLEPL